MGQLVGPASGDLILSIDAGTQSMRAAWSTIRNDWPLGQDADRAIRLASARLGRAAPDYYWEMLCLTTKRLLAESAVLRIASGGHAGDQRHTSSTWIGTAALSGRPSSGWTSARRTWAKVLPGWGIALAGPSASTSCSNTPPKSCRSTGSSRTNPRSGTGRTSTSSFRASSPIA